MEIFNPTKMVQSHQYALTDVAKLKVLVSLDRNYSPRCTPNRKSANNKRLYNPVNITLVQVSLLLGSFIIVRTI